MDQRKRASDRRNGLWDRMAQTVKLVDSCLQKSNHIEHMLADNMQAQMVRRRDLISKHNKLPAPPSHLKGLKSSNSALVRRLQKLKSFLIKGKVS